VRSRTCGGRRRRRRALPAAVPPPTHPAGRAASRTAGTGCGGSTRPARRAARARSIAGRSIRWCRAPTPRLPAGGVPGSCRRTGVDRAIRLPVRIAHDGVRREHVEERPQRAVREALVEPALLVGGQDHRDGAVLGGRLPLHRGAAHAPPDRTGPSHPDDLRRRCVRSGEGLEERAHRGDESADRPAQAHGPSGTSSANGKRFETTTSRRNGTVRRRVRSRDPTPASPVGHGHASVHLSSMP